MGLTDIEEGSPADGLNPWKPQAEPEAESELEEEEVEYSDEEQAAVVTITDDADEALGLVEQIPTRVEIKPEPEKPAKEKKRKATGPNTMISSEYGDYLNKSDRRRARVSENARRREKAEMGKEKRRASRQGQRGKKRGGKR